MDSVLELIDSAYTDYGCDLDQFNYYFDFDPMPSCKRTNSELPEAKRQRLDQDECESYGNDEFVELLSNAIKTEEFTDISSFQERKEEISLKEDTSQNFHMVDAMDNSAGYSFTDTDASGEKSNSGSTGKQSRQLKVVGRPLREKPQEPKKIKKPLVQNCDKPKEEVVVQQQEIVKEPLTVQPKNITLSLKMVEVNKPPEPNLYIPTNIIGDVKPQQLKLKCIDSQTPALVAGPQSQNEVISKTWQPTIQMAQNHMMNIPRPTQGALYAPHDVKETIVFDPNQMTVKKAQKENFYIPKLGVPCKNLKVVSMAPQKILQITGVRGQPVVQHPVKSTVTKHIVTLKPNPNLPPRPQKVFTLVPYRSDRSGETSAVKTPATQKIILKTRNEEDIVSAEDFARFISGRGL